MALIKDLSSERLIPLKCIHTLGRRRDITDYAVLHKEVSGLHATLSWNGSYWELLDNSRNGTFLDGQRLDAGRRYPISHGQTIALTKDSSIGFKVWDISAPEPLLLDDSFTCSQGLNDFTALPDSDDPQVTIYRDGDLWMAEEKGETNQLVDGSMVTISGQTWRFFHPGLHELTQVFSPPPKEALEFHISISPSRDLEDIGVSIDMPPQSIDLGYKSHHYLLYLLAKAKKDDRLLGLEPKDIGWMNTNQLSQMMKLEINHINIQVYRLRKALLDVIQPKPNPTKIIERKSGAIRLGFDTFSIHDV